MKTPDIQMVMEISNREESYNLQFIKICSVCALISKYWLSLLRHCCNIRLHKLRAPQIELYLQAASDK